MLGASFRSQFTVGRIDVGIATSGQEAILVVVRVRRRATRTRLAETVGIGVKGVGRDGVAVVLNFR